MSEMWQGVLIGISGVIGLAIVAVLVSKNSQTGSVIQSAASGFSSILQAAVSPVTGSGSGASAVSSPFGIGNSTGNTYSI
jgi:hypothetical protein